MVEKTTRRNVLLGSIGGLGLLPLSSLPIYSKEINEKLVPVNFTQIRETILEENRISISGKDGVISQHNPLELMDIAVNWFRVAQYRDWKYYDDIGLIVSYSQLDEYIKELQDVRSKTKDN